jgi:hypothetical protein
MRNTHIDNTRVEQQVEKRQMFHMGLFLHFATYVVINVIVWAIWLLIPNKGDSFPIFPLIVTGAWTVVLLVHAFIVTVAHNPRQVRHDEIKREVQKQRLEKP